MTAYGNISQALAKPALSLHKRHGAMSKTIIVGSHSGRIDGVVQWLALDFGNGETLENDPFAEHLESSWDAPYTPLVTPIETAPGDQLAITLRRRGTLLTIDVDRHVA